MPSGVYIRTETSGMSGKHHSMETKTKMSEIAKKKIGEKNNNWKGGKIERKCLICGKIFYVKQKDIKVGCGKFCSNKCRGIWFSQNKKEANSQNWKGGKRVSTRRANGKRHNFGFIPLNEWQEGYVFHHLDKNYGIYIPEEEHKSIWHSVLKSINMDKMNALAFNYL